MELSSKKKAAPAVSTRVLSWVFDWLFLIGFAAVLTTLKSRFIPYGGTLRWNVLYHLLLPLLLLPFVNYSFYRLFGQTPGQYAFAIEWRRPDGLRARRLYDWLFLLDIEKSDSTLGPLQRLILIAALLIFSAGATAFLWMHDLTIRPFTKTEVPLFAPDLKDPQWIPLPFFYATGAVPFSLGSEAENSIEFGLPYERGPPNRFIGKITVYWRGLDSRLIYTGPLTLSAPESQKELEQCFSKWMGCNRIRRKFWTTSFAPFFEGRTITRNESFHVENGFLGPEECAQGIYLRSTAENGRIREAYYLVGPKMAVQGLLLDRPDREEGEVASQTLAKMVGSIRLTGDLAAPRAFINPRLARLQISAKSTLPELIAAEGHLLAKVSIEPKEPESYYHLAGLGVTLFRRAKETGKIELAASSRIIVKSSLQFIKDISPESKHISEMEAFAAEVQ